MRKPFRKEWYHLPTMQYDSQFLKALAMAVHCEVLDPSELQYWFDSKWTLQEMTVEMYNRVRTSRE